MIIEFNYNNEIFKRVLNKKQDIRKALLKMRPEELFTELYVSVKEDGNNFEKRYNLKEGKRLYLDEVSLDILVNSINQFYGR